VLFLLKTMTRPDTYESEFIAIADLKPWPRNYKDHGDNQVKVLGNSLRNFGQFKNIIVWKDFIIGGHGLVDAARSNGYDEVEVKRLPHDWTESQVEAVYLETLRMIREFGLL
jgi:ParB-like chromosome segregation protein Spo0J